MLPAGKISSMYRPKILSYSCLVLLVASSYGKVYREPIFEDDISPADDLDQNFFSDVRAEPYSVANVEDGFSPFDGDGAIFDLRKRQQSNPTGNTQATANVNPGSAAGIAPIAGQTQNVSAIPSTNSTDATTNGQTPGLVGPSRNPNEDKVNCSDPVTGRANDCWAQLHLTKYVNDWVDTHECYQGEGFATCYLRQNGFTTLDCSGIAVNACPPPQDPSLVLDPQKFYVAYNIYSINQFFLSWYLAVGSAGPIATGNIGKIVDIVNPPSNTPVTVQKVLVAFQSIFALAPGLAGVWAAKNDYSYQFQVWAQSLSNALATAPNIGRYLFPTDQATGKVIQMSELSSNFAGILQQVLRNLNSTCVQVMANHTEFLAFASQGNFSSKPQPLSEQSNYLYYAFNTYIISQAMNGNNIYAVIGKGTNVSDLARNGTQTAYDLKDCKNGYNEQMVCDAWWFSRNYNSSFTLDNFSHMERGYGDQLTKLFANLTTGELLFEGAYSCNSQGNFGGPVNITVTAAGVNTACISQLKVLTWDMSCHKEDERGGDGPAPDCEFLEIPRQPAFWFNNMHFTSSSPRFSVPYGYLGPAMARKNRFPLSRT